MQPISNFGRIWNFFCHLQMAKHKKKAGKKAAKVMTEQDVKSSTVPALNKLSSTEPNDQLWAVTTLSNLIQQEENVEALMNGNIVEKLLAVIGNVETELNLEALGALRNVLTIVGHTACVQLLSLRGIDKLLSLIPLTVQFALSSTAPKVPLDYKLELDQILACLWCLAETSDDAVENLTSIDLITLLVDLLVDSSAPGYLRRTSGQFLNTLSESNPIFLQILKNKHDLVQKLQDFTQNQNLLTWENNQVELMVLGLFVLTNSKTIFTNDQMGRIYALNFGLLDFVANYDIVGQYASVEIAALAVDKANSEVDESKISANAVNKLLTPVSPDQVIIFLNFRRRLIVPNHIYLLYSFP